MNCDTNEKTIVQKLPKFSLIIHYIHDFFFLLSFVSSRLHELGHGQLFTVIKIYLLQR